jgi:hypothetical protein
MAEIELIFPSCPQPFEGKTDIYIFSFQGEWKIEL